MGISSQSPQEGILPFFFSVRDRVIQPEIMDRQDLEPRLRAGALQGLERVNFISRSAASVWRPILAYAQMAGRRLRVLDLACGGGDVALAIARYARQNQLPIEIHGADLSAESIAFARQRANNKAHFFQLDILQNPIPEGYDVILNTLFMHHLEDESTLQVLSSIRSASPGLTVISDLRRSAPGFALAHVACRILTRNYVVHYDGPRSVAAAYTREEFSALANQAGMTRHVNEPVWPFRFLFTWSPT